MKKVALSLALLASISLEALAGPITIVYGTGGIQGSKTCPKPMATVCAKIDSYSDDFYGDSRLIMFDEYTQEPNGEEYDVRIIWLGPENQSAEVEFLN